MKRALAVPQHKPPVLAEMVLDIPRVFLLLVHRRACFFWGVDKVVHVAVPPNFADMEGAAGTVTLAGKHLHHLYACNARDTN